MREIKKWVVVFDFDGTLTPKPPKGKSLFVAIDEGVLPPEGQTIQQELFNYYIAKARAGTMTPIEDEAWLLESVKNYIRYGLTIEKARVALENIPLRPGVRECLEMLQREGVPTAIVSYGVAPLVELVLERHNIPVPGLIHKVCAVRLTAHEETGFTGYDKSTVVLQSTKGEWSRHFADLHGVPHDNILAVGDTGGDRLLGHLKENRLALANDEAHAAEIAPFMGEVIVTDDFSPVTAWLRSKMGLI